MQPGRNPSVLLVEESSISMKIIKFYLTQNGFDVETASDGAEAVSLFGVSHFDVVLMDIQMPNMDGYRATRLIRQSFCYKKRPIPIIALSSHDLEMEKKRCSAAGMDDFISKPMSWKTLIEVIQRNLYCVDTRRLSERSTVRIEENTVVRRLDGERELLIKLVGPFTAETPGQVESLEEAVISGSNQQIAEIVHLLKGAVGHFALDVAIRSATELEEVEIFNRTKTLAGLFENLKCGIDQLFSQMQECYPSDSSVSIESN